MSNYFKHKIRSKSPAEIVGWVLLGIIGFTGLFILFGFVIMWLWNWLMPELFGLTTITFWQAIGICLLSKILIGGFGGGKGGGHKSHKKHHGKDYKCEDKSKSDLSKWKFYDKFWEEEGNDAFEKYLLEKNQEKEARNEIS